MNELPVPGHVGLLYTAPAALTESLQSAAAHELLHQCLPLYASTRRIRLTDSPVILRTEMGKPYFPDFPDVHFNLSHSGERVMCVISPFEVGCDVEIIKGDRGRLAERFFKPEESAWIKHFETLEKQSEAFYRLWTLKECYMKVTGRGMSLMPDKFALRVDENENISLYHDGDRPEYDFREIDLHDGYRYAYCMKNNGENAPQEIRCVDLNILL